MDKARHAFGKSENLAAALASKRIDAYDILFLDGDTEPKLGWVDKDGIIRLVQDKAQIIRVDALPAENGDENVVYIYNNEGYIWDSVNSQCIPMSKSADLKELESQVSDLETQMAKKMDETAVQSMIETAIEDVTSVEVVEF